MAFYGKDDIDTLDLTPTQKRVATEWFRVAGSLNDLSILYLKQATETALNSAHRRLASADDANWTGFDTAHINNALAGGEQAAYEIMKAAA